jgi:flagellar basal body-associated protein FliL
MVCGKTLLADIRAARRLRGICLALAAAMLIAVSEPRPAAAASLQYYEIKRLILPVIRRSGLEGHITLKVLLELNDVSIRSEVTAKMLFLRDDFIRVLNRYIARRPRLLFGVKLEEIKALLLRSAEKILGPGKVKSVLVQAVASRRF